MTISFRVRDLVVLRVKLLRVWLDNCLKVALYALGFEKSTAVCRMEVLPTKLVKPKRTTWADSILNLTQCPCSWMKGTLVDRNIFKFS